MQRHDKFDDIIFDCFKVVDNSQYQMGFIHKQEQRESFISALLFEYNLSCCGGAYIHYVRAYEVLPPPIKKRFTANEYYDGIYDWLLLLPGGYAPAYGGGNILCNRRAMVSMTLPVEVDKSDDDTQGMRKLIRRIHNRNPERLTLSTPTFNPSSSRYITTATVAVGAVEMDSDAWCFEWMR